MVVQFCRSFIVKRENAISAQKVLCCHVVKGAWNGTAAAKMYADAVGPALRQAFPSKKVFNLLISS